MLKKIIKIVSIIVLTLIGIVGTYLLCAYLLPKIPVRKEIVNDPEEITIYVFTNGAHTDVVVPARNDIHDWTKDFKYADTRTADSTFGYLGIGWGDKGFYMDIPTWNDLTFRIAFCAAFWLNSTAIHATYYRCMREGDDCKRITITKSQYIRLIDYITGYIVTDGDKRAINIPTDAVYGDHDAFYEAEGRYSVFFTCNTWTNNALKRCGQRACLWTAFDTGIFYQYSDK